MLNITHISKSFWGSSIIFKGMRDSGLSQSPSPLFFMSTSVPWVGNQPGEDWLSNCTIYWETFSISWKIDPVMLRFFLEWLLSKFTTPSYSPKLWDWKTQQGKISSSLSRRQVPHPHIKILDRFVFLKFTFKVSYMSRKGKVSPLQNSADFK